MKPFHNPPPAIRPTVAVRMKTDIEKASADGVAPDDMALHLTLGDVELLKRDRTVPMADISFVGGTMRYLGVKIVRGDVRNSVLWREGDALPPGIPVKPAKAPPKPRAKKKVEVDADGVPIPKVAKAKKTAKTA